MSENQLAISDKGAIWMPRTFWKMPSLNNAKIIKFNSPEELWIESKKYFIWSNENPLYDTKTYNCAGEIITKEVPKIRAFSVKALCLFINISTATWWQYIHKEEFLDVTSRVLDIIYCQKFEGAAVDIFNTSIITKDLGLSDRHEVSGPDGMPLNPQTVVNINAEINPKEASQLYHRMLKDAKSSV